ncbi:MAG: alpha/beta hydrolase [Actinomycetota bacterium]|nr:alpha/beta hydrolase [Actinomycetota bacterium]
MTERLEIAALDVPVEGGRLAAFALGRDGDGRPPVIAVHGITASSRTWLAVARALGHRVPLVAVDLRGRGASHVLPAPYGTAAHVADLLALLDRLELARAVLVGHSLGAYLVSRLAVEHPDRVSALVLVDGGLPIPGSQGVDPQEFIDGFLGPALARLRLRFASPEAYRNWWRAHPAIAGGDVAEPDLIAYADYDLIGEPPELRSAVLEPAVRADAAELAEAGQWAPALTVPATLLCAPRGLIDDPHPMQPLAEANRWASGAPERAAYPVDDVNHYTITLGATGAAAVAELIASTAGA